MRKMVAKKVRKHTIRDLERMIGDASIILWEYDGYYCPKKKTGNAEGLASVIDDAFHALQGRHWDRGINKRYAKRKKDNPLRNR